MSSKNLRVYKILIISLIVTVTMTGLVYRGIPYSGEYEISGLAIPMASATDIQTLEKEVGQVVSFKAKVKNTGNVETTYVIVVKWKEHGAENWECDSVADMSLHPSQLETSAIGSMECTETMMGKYFDVMFILYDHESETVLDEKIIEKALYVKEKLVSGTLINFWIE